MISIVLFSDVANTAGLIDRLGDSGAARAIQSHWAAATERLEAEGAVSITRTGDGLAARFDSAAKAVRAGISLQRLALHPVLGETLELRVGIAAGETADGDDGDAFGIPLLLARRLCERAEAGEILTVGVAGLLAGRAAFRFQDAEPCRLPGLPQSVFIFRVRYEHSDLRGLLSRTPFVGRSSEMSRLLLCLEELRTGGGSVILVTGEPGVGKTRLLEEIGTRARVDRVRPLVARCYEGDSTPYRPFASVVGALAWAIEPSELRAALGPARAIVTELAPDLARRFEGAPEPVPLPPEQQRARALDAMARFVLDAAVREPLFLIVDDLQWADAGTVLLFHHLARFARGHPLCLAGIYRDVEVSGASPLASLLDSLPREAEPVTVSLRGLSEEEVGQMLRRLAGRPASEAAVRRLRDDTGGNPFFLREVLLQLVEEGRIRIGEERTELVGGGVSESARQVIDRRLRRLSKEAKKLLSAASGFRGPFALGVAIEAAGLPEQVGFTAADEAESARLLAPTGSLENYDFVHTLVRDALYRSLSPARRARLHRAIAGAMEAVGGDGDSHGGELARHLHASRSLPGAERGVGVCLAAAESADRATAFEEASRYLRMAIDLAPREDSRIPGILGSLARALARSNQIEESVEVAEDAAARVEAAEGPDAASQLLSDLAAEIWGGTLSPLAFRLSTRALALMGERRDLAWAKMMDLELNRRESEEHPPPGVFLEWPESEELSEVASRHIDALVQLPSLVGRIRFRDRADVLARAPHLPTPMMSLGGALRESEALCARYVPILREVGDLFLDMHAHLFISEIRFNLGDLGGAEDFLAETESLARRIPGRSRFADLQVGALHCWKAFLRGDREAIDGALSRRKDTVESPEAGPVRAAPLATHAMLHAFLGNEDEAMSHVRRVLPGIERAPGWSINHLAICGWAGEALWLLGRSEHASMIERNVREKHLAPDFRGVMCESRLTLARMCALQGRFEEASDWFASARPVLEEQGARPLRALADFDEGWMFLRRGESGDRERALPLLDRARGQFGEIGMHGWIPRCDDVLHDSNGISAERETSREAAIEHPAAPEESGESIFRKEGDVWLLRYAGRSTRMRDSKGLESIARLLRSPGEELHAFDLAASDGADAGAPSYQVVRDSGLRPGRLDAPVAILDATARRAYRERIEALRSEIAEAGLMNDPGRKESLERELAFITRELSSALGLGGKTRKAADVQERARVAVTKRIRTAIQRIEKRNADLAGHLRRSIRTGRFFSYWPGPQDTPSWQL